MPRALVHYLPREMAVLGLIECALAFAVIYAVIGSAGAAGSSTMASVPLLRNGVALAASLTIVAAAVSIAIGLYRPEVCLDRRRQMTAIAVAAAAFTILLLLSGGISNTSTRARQFYLAQLLFGWVGAMTLIRLGYSFAITRLPLSRRILVLGDQQRAASLSNRLQSRRGQPFEPVALPDGEFSWQSLQLQRIWAVVLTSDADAAIVEPLLTCKLLGTRILGAAAFQEDYLGRIDLDTVTANDLLLGQGYTCTRLSAAMKRLCDIAIAITMLILMLPLMALTALAVKVDSAGPVFYCQQRVGRCNKPFMLFKFRSMAADAEAGGSPRWAQTKDPRVTRVGRFIRATRIDELPQLANVIKGEMSLVGPRPERPHFVEQLERAIPFYRQRSFVKPGLTGWAQVNFPYGASVEDAREKLSYDLFYVKNRSITLDMLILLSTIRVVLFREGAR